MLGRLFGKNKDASGEAVCAECGRTLLAGELTQRIVDDDGTERLLCSLCAQSSELAGGELQKASSGNATRPPDQDAEAAGAGPEEPGRDENAALWKAIKDRDAQIERLKKRSPAAKPSVRSFSAGWPACRRPPRPRRSAKPGSRRRDRRRAGRRRSARRVPGLPGDRGRDPQRGERRGAASGRARRARRARRLPPRTPPTSPSRSRQKERRTDRDRGGRRRRPTPPRSRRRPTPRPTPPRSRIRPRP